MCYHECIDYAHTTVIMPYVDTSVPVPTPNPEDITINTMHQLALQAMSNTCHDNA